jgi:hypothetical protein
VARLAVAVAIMLQITQGEQPLQLVKEITVVRVTDQLTAAVAVVELMRLGLQQHRLAQEQADLD